MTDIFYIFGIAFIAMSLLSALTIFFSSILEAGARKEEEAERVHKRLIKDAKIEATKKLMAEIKK